MRLRSAFCVLLLIEFLRIVTSWKLKTGGKTTRRRSRDHSLCLFCMSFSTKRAFMLFRALLLLSTAWFSRRLQLDGALLGLPHARRWTGARLMGKSSLVSFNCGGFNGYALRSKFLWEFFEFFVLLRNWRNINLFVFKISKFYFLLCFFNYSCFNFG